MARSLRIQFENACYHIPCRGNSRQKIFADAFDRKAFPDLLGRSREIYQVEVLACVRMTNHFHLLIKTPLATLQEFMRYFNVSYTSDFNRKHKRPGHLYQGGEMLSDRCRSLSHGGLNQRKIGELMGVDYSSVSTERKKSEEETRKN